jgi:ectoine hydroxylase-related dioxygenase (phytanoyl-CoA dioxygenase family)
MTQLALDEVRRYRREGYLSPLDGVDGERVAALRHALEAMEARRGGRLTGIDTFKPHLVSTDIAALVRDPAILGPVASLVGPDILLLHLTIWIKEPRSEAFISWHQDATYFGLFPHDHVTAWVALSASTGLSGCVEVAPGSHLGGQAPFETRHLPGNMLTTGQWMAPPPADQVRAIELAPGQFSLHHTHLLHNSRPNRSDHRRIGLGISYIPTHVRCSSAERLTASLVAGVDRFGHFDPEPAPIADDDPAARAFHAEAMVRWNRSRTEQRDRIARQAA